MTDKEREYAQSIPRRKYKVYYEEAQKQSQAARPAQLQAQAQVMTGDSIVCCASRFGTNPL